MTDRRWPLVVAALLGATAVMAGAFGAHGLRAVLTERYLATWETAAHYQLTHALALLALALSMQAVPRLANSSWCLWSARCFILGSLIFSGSLYALVLSGIGWLGAITPLGGALLIMGWLLLAIAAVKR